MKIIMKINLKNKTRLHQKIRILKSQVKISFLFFTKNLEKKLPGPILERGDSSFSQTY